MKNHSPSITLIGAGNVATQLGLALKEAGYRIEQVYSPTRRSAEALAKKLKSSFITDLSELTDSSRIYIIALKDDAIQKAAKKIRLKDQLLVHTSGSIAMKALKGSSKNIGVLYPVQTFSKEKKTDFRKVPLCLEASSRNALRELEYFAKSISGQALKINERQRKQLHLAAVFACNFSNHLYSIAESILKEQKLSLDILQPLIEETAQKIRSMSPVKAQTGPAVRGDKKTMQAHLELLKKNKELKRLYKVMSGRIEGSKK